MKLGHILIIIVLFLLATIIVSIPSYRPKPEPVPDGRAICIPTLSGWQDLINRTTALSYGFKGYILARLIKPRPTNLILAIPVNGTFKVQVELWFVSYDWMNATETKVTVNPYLNYTGEEFFSFNEFTEPNGNLTLRVNEPTVLNVTLSVPKGQKYGVGLGYNFRAPLIDVKSDYSFLDSTNNLYEPKPLLRVQPANVTGEGSVTLKVCNPGPWNIEYGAMYNIEKMVNGTWTHVVDRTNWADVMIEMGAGYEWSQSVNTTGLDSGLYRVSKEIDYYGQKQTFYADFNVKRPLELSDRQALVELALNEQIGELLLGVSKGISLPEGALILLSTPNLGEVEVPSIIKGVATRVLTQDEIDALSRVKHVNYMFFDKIVETDSDRAEVTLTFVGNYKVGTYDANVIGDSVMTYSCVKQSGVWIITSGFGGVP